jgi:hypothetical protein
LPPRCALSATVPGRWSYRCVRAADPSTFESTIELDGHKSELAHVRYGITVDKQRRQIGVVCYHRRSPARRTPSKGARMAAEVCS